MRQFQVLMTKIENTGKSKIKLERLGRVSTDGYKTLGRNGQTLHISAEQNAYDLLRAEHANRGWDFTVDDVVEVFD